MNLAGSTNKAVKNWTCEQHGGTVSIFMKRKLRIQIAFEPTRLGKEHLHQAYELVVPVQRRRIRELEPPAEHTETEQETKQRKQERGVS
jgi:hypothetical protein